MWTSVVGYLSFLFGSLIHRVGHWIAIVIGVVAVTAIVVGVNFLRRHEERLKAEAEVHVVREPRNISTACGHGESATTLPDISVPPADRLIA
jgi:hypothetical protein